MSWNFSSSTMIIFLTAIYLISFLFRPFAMFLYDIAKYLSNILYLLTVGCFIEKYVAKKKKSLARQKRILTINIHKFISLVQKCLTMTCFICFSILFISFLGLFFFAPIHPSIRPPHTHHTYISSILNLIQSRSIIKLNSIEFYISQI